MIQKHRRLAPKQTGHAHTLCQGGDWTWRALRWKSCTDSLVGQQVHRSIDVSIIYWQKNLYCDGRWHFKLWRRTRLNSSTPLSCSWQVLSRKPQKELNFVLTTISFVSICIVCDSMFYQSTFLLSFFLPPVKKKIALCRWCQCFMPKLRQTLLTWKRSN